MKLTHLFTIILVLSMTSFIFGCMEEEANETGNNGGNGGGNGNGGGEVVPAMDVEVTNLEYRWEEDEENALDTPELSVDCEAINYGGPGTCIVGIVANSPNSTITMKRIVYLDSNEQKSLSFWGKIPEEPVNFSSFVERQLSDAILQPKSEEMDVEVVNIFNEIHGWIDENQTELEITVYASAVNFEVTGYVTLVVNVEGVDFSKMVEERIYIEWYDFQDLQFDMIVPDFPVNTTITTKRPQPG